MKHAEEPNRGTRLPLVITASFLFGGVVIGICALAVRYANGNVKASDYGEQVLRLDTTMGAYKQVLYMYFENHGIEKVTGFSSCSGVGPDLRAYKPPLLDATECIYIPTQWEGRPVSLWVQAQEGLCARGKYVERVFGKSSVSMGEVRRLLKLPHTGQ